MVKTVNRTDIKRTDVRPDSFHNLLPFRQAPAAADGPKVTAEDG